jgi:hypothetical protein
MKWFLAAAAVVGIGAGIYFTIMFQGPRMQVQPHIRAYQQTMPLPPKGIVPVERDRYEVPSASQARGMKNQLPDTLTIRRRGKVYYNYYCVFCHGENGQGDGPVGYGYMPVPADLHAPKVLGMSDGDLMRAMLLGIGHEPVLPRIVSPEHRWYLVSYIRMVGKTPPVPAENQGSQVIVKGEKTK